MDETDLLIDLHVRNDRQAPGSDHATRQAIELARLEADAGLNVADIGCGTGASTLVLAHALNARVTAVDSAPRFVERLRERAEREGLADRITATVGRMESLPFNDGEFDVMWSEGAIYNMGFEAGVRAWHRFLRPGGVLVISELTWTTSSRPVDIETHWTTEYPGISTVSANMQTLERAGYLPIGFFFLSPECWEENYHAPLRAAFPDFLSRHENRDEARRIVAAEQTEMRLFRERGEWYGYAFYIARKATVVDTTLLR